MRTAVPSSGDELLVMLTGGMGLVLEEDGQEVVVELPAGRAFIVPRGTWHRQVVRSSGNYLGATYGKGTQHRARGCQFVIVRGSPTTGCS